MINRGAFRPTSTFKKFEKSNFDKCVEHVVNGRTDIWTDSLAHFGKQNGYLAHTIVHYSHLFPMVGKFLIKFYAWW